MGKAISKPAPVDGGEAVVKKLRGRPKAAAKVEDGAMKRPAGQDGGLAAPKKQRGRPRKADGQARSKDGAIKKRRGRPKRSDTKLGGKVIAKLKTNKWLVKAKEMLRGKLTGQFKGKDKAPEIKLENGATNGKDWQLGKTRGRKTADKVVSEVRALVSACEATIAEAAVADKDLTADISKAQIDFKKMSDIVEEAASREKAALDKLTAAREARLSAQAKIKEAENVRDVAAKAVAILEIEMNNDAKADFGEAKRLALEVAETAKRVLKHAQTKGAAVHGAMKAASEEKAVKPRGRPTKGAR